MGGAGVWGSCSRENLAMREHCGGGWKEGGKEEGRRKKMQKIFFFFSREHQGHRWRNLDPFSPSLGSPPELRGGLVRIGDGGKIAES